ncbi:MAG: adenylate/guanylate cyclase domain-containing protein [Gloeomargarita sp. SKYBB_i_bin120]|nr:adenylate/guanylate cyclase domain-containing protein [Gloeomargarita sp. SKYG98]MCS7291842.1 adenylate/guanylate cyclase domain-containing protein [Gloeomargarita sp. SKYB120]MDW8177402.1 adenylate/guanylate cyclase domain-containing protein [Gloeomargarita sp. SKYBB_i_bin120]
MGNVNTSTAYLLVTTPTGEQYIPLVGGNTWSIGRADRNGIVLADRWVSRHHAMIQRLDTGEYYFIDFGSRNGSFLRGRRVSIPVALQDGDQLTLGETKIVFHVRHSVPPTTVPPKSKGSDAGEHTTEVLHVRCLISVLVVDIREYSLLARQLDEALLAQALGSWFRQVGEIIQRFGSRVDKYIGDAVMAVWIHSAQGPSQNDMLRILRTVWAIDKTTANLHYQHPLPGPLRVGVGLNTGYAMVGNSGSGERPEYTALGDTVNAAFRLESATRTLGLDLAMGQSTFSYIQDMDQAREFFAPYTTTLKGYDEPVTLWGTSFNNLRLFLQLHNPEGGTRSGTFTFPLRQPD